MNTPPANPAPALEWHPISEPPPRKFGWFAAAILPVNHADIGVAEINEWRSKFGFSKVWYNGNSVGKWWEPDPHGPRSEAIAERITHWAELPPVPMIDEKPA